MGHAGRKCILAHIQKNGKKSLIADKKKHYQNHVLTTEILDV
jgi:hypothetical protein